MASIKILIVDDSITIRRIITNALKTVGFTDTIEASNGKEALEKLPSGKVDFIITDWNMPEMNGLDFIKIVRSNPLYSSMPILMITTRGTEHDVVEALQAKVNSYIMKPFTPQELKEKIEGILKTVQVSTE
ncbi:MAG: response regulator [Bacteroidota bacterium]|jgi:Response regulator containing CheY-like receiver, AAA-type ATPase, and DNA-binding domains